MTNRRLIWIIILILFIGAMVGSLFGELLGYILPEGVVKQFFLQSAEISLGGILGSNNNALELNLGVISLILGLKITLNFAGLLGMGVAYYFLRYFR